ncbi:MAG: hypothetical protein HYX67_06295 [Candidatus Melainabacteria bacterium]|nr:hypothetical protein [Candidatus Melainabacteria bacterium]
MQQFARLENWTVVTPKSALSNSYLTGSVFDHPRIADGTTVYTTPILRIDRCLAQTANTTYILGKEKEESTPQTVPNFSPTLTLLIN